MKQVSIDAFVLFSTHTFRNKESIFSHKGMHNYIIASDTDYDY